MELAALILLPFAAWHLYRAVRALRSGAFESFGLPVERLSLAKLFWFRVAREFLLGTLFAALLLSLALGSGWASLVWLFGGYVVVYLTLIVITVGGRR